MTDYPAKRAGVTASPKAFIGMQVSECVGQPGHLHAVQNLSDGVALPTATTAATERGDIAGERRLHCAAIRAFDREAIPRLHCPQLVCQPTRAATMKSHNASVCNYIQALMLAREACQWYCVLYSRQGEEPNRGTTGDRSGNS